VAMTGKHTRETKLKISRAMRGRKKSKAHAAKVSATLRRKWNLIRELEAAEAARNAAA
jgi:hypothetical protein